MQQPADQSASGLFGGLEQGKGSEPRRRAFGQQSGGPEGERVMT